MGKLLSGLGFTGGQPKPKEEIPFPSPMEFARSAYSGPKEEEPPRSETPDLNVIVEKAENGSVDWRTCLETVLNQENNLEQEVFGNILFLVNFYFAPMCVCQLLVKNSPYIVNVFKYLSSGL